MEKRKSVAIIGGGIAGLTAAYQLNKRHKVTLFERSGRLGGNAYTLTTHDGENLDIAVAVFGKAGYPNFYALLSELGIRPRLSPGSFMAFYSLEMKDGLYFTLSWQGLRIRSIMAGLDLFRGLVAARRLHRQGKLAGLTVQELLEMVPVFGEEPRILLMSVFCLLSSMSAAEVLEAPAEFFLEKLRVHHDILSPRAAYSVRAVDLGTQTYVKALADRFRDGIELNSRIARVARSESSVTLKMEDGSERTFDAVVFACNADQALKLLERPTAKEKAVLGSWKYKEGRVVVHRDHSSFPPKELIQAYTFLYTGTGRAFDTSVSGALWREPHASRHCDYISTQHPNFPIRKDLIELDTVLRTPIFDFQSVGSREQLPSLNGHHNSYFCGSHFGFGLHEDAVTSAIQVAKHLGVTFRRPPVRLASEALEIVEDISHWLWRRNLATG